MAVAMATQPQSRWQPVRRSVVGVLPQQAETGASLDWEQALAATADAIDQRTKLSSLFKLTRDGHASELRQYLEREELSQMVLNMFDDDGLGLLHYAVKHGHAE